MPRRQLFPRSPLMVMIATLIGAGLIACTLAIYLYETDDSRKPTVKAVHVQRGESGTRNMAPALPARK